MTKVYELARQLGQAILESPEGKRLNDARFVFDGDEEAQRLLFSYTEMAERLNQMAQDIESYPAEVLEAEKCRLNALMDEVKANEKLMELLDAEAKVYVLTEQVMAIVSATVKGEEDCCSSCSSGGCAGCSGCH